MNSDLMSLEILTISVADPYTQQEQADFDLWSVPPIQSYFVCTYRLSSDYKCGGE